jgi:hypothetical protein
MEVLVTGSVETVDVESVRAGSRPLMHARMLLSPFAGVASAQLHLNHSHAARALYHTTAYAHN